LSASKSKGEEDHVKRYLSAREACLFLGISKSTFFRKKAQGYFKSSKITGKYDRNLLEAEVHASTQPSASVSGKTTTIIGLIQKYHRATTLKSLTQPSMKN
jgi:predicted DNA-binding transcriptional regulator AlpA